MSALLDIGFIICAALALYACFPKRHEIADCAQAARAIQVEFGPHKAYGRAAYWLVRFIPVWRVVWVWCLIVTVGLFINTL